MKLSYNPLIASVLTFAASSTLHAQTWDGNTDPNLGGNWSTALNWTTDTVPTTGNTAVLDTTGANRTVIYDAAASGALGTLTFNQSSAFINTLSVQRALTITNALTLGATGGGTSQLAIAPSSAALSVAITNGLTVNSGGLLTLGVGTNNGLGSTLNAAITMSGGTISASAGATGSSTQAQVTSLNMSGGNLTLVAPTSNDTRLRIANNFTASGGTIAISGAGGGQLVLGGATNTISGATTLGTNITLSLDTASQSLSSTTALGNVLLRGSGTLVKTISSSAAGSNIGQIQFINATTGGSTTLKLGGNLKTGTSLPSAQNFGSQGGGSTGTVNFGIDTNGFALDLTSNTGSYTPNLAVNTSAITTNYTFSGTGRIKATAFTLSTASQVNVGAGTILESTGTTAANILSGGGSFDATSTFLYSGAATTGSPATLASTRSIGNLLVTGTGALQLLGTSIADAYQNDITVRSGTLIVGGNGLLGGGAATPIKLSDGVSTANSRITLQLNNGIALDRRINVTAPFFGTDQNSQRPRVLLSGTAATGAISSEITYGLAGAGIAPRLEIVAVDAASKLTLSGQILAPTGQTAASNLLINGGNGGTGTVELTNTTNNFTGGVLVVNGTLLLTGNVPTSGASLVGTGGTLALADGATPGAATLSALLTGPFTFARATTLGTNAGTATNYTAVLGMADSGSGDAVWSGNINSSNDTRTKTLRLNAPVLSSALFTGVIGANAGSGSVSVEKTGAGTVQLNGLNTYDGNTTVSAGTLILNLSNVLADTSTLAIGSVSEPSAFLNLPNAGTDLVAALSIDGIAQPAGLYDASNSGGAITGIGKIQVGAGAATPFELWISTNFPSIPDADKDPSDDPDFDGSSNLLEFALNGNPTNPSINGYIASLVQDSSVPVGNEITLIVAVRDGATFVSGANGVRSASVDGITYTIEGSLDLAFPASAVSKTGPSDTAPAASGLPSLAGSAWEYHTFKLDASEGLSGKGFLRLKVTQP